MSASATGPRRRAPGPAVLLWAAGGVLLVVAVVITVTGVLDGNRHTTLYDGAYAVASALYPVIAAAAAFSAIDAFREGRGPNPLSAAMLVTGGLLAVAAAGVTAAVGGDDEAGAAQRATVDPSRFGIATRQNACSNVGFGSVPPLPARYAYVKAQVPDAFKKAAEGSSGVLARRITENGKTVAQMVSVALGPQTQLNEAFITESGRTLKQQGATLHFLGVKPFGALSGTLRSPRAGVMVAHGTCRGYLITAADERSAGGIGKVVLDADQRLKQVAARRLRQQQQQQQQPAAP